MGALHNELLAIATGLDVVADAGRAAPVATPLERLRESAEEVGKAWSGSWIGYQSRVYYDGLGPPLAGHHFSAEWGMEETLAVRGTSGNWREYAVGEVEKAIRSAAGNPSLEKAKKAAGKARDAFESERQELLSLLATALNGKADTFLSSIQEQIQKMALVSKGQLLRLRQPEQVMSRDSLAMSQGLHAPPHLAVLAEVGELRLSIDACAQLAKLARKAASHLERGERHIEHKLMNGTKVFIGHGQSLMWLELKDFIQDRLKLPWEEFNRVPVAGVSNATRLSEMLESAAMAFLILTGEDEQPGGKLHARQNVVHEAGLFQGRLGFSRAIVLLEDGCEEFSNIQGLGQVRFPKGNIRAAFDEVRRILEREGLIN